MSIKLFDQMGGVVTLSLKGKNQEKLLNMAMSRGIYIWDIRRSNDIIFLKIRNSGLDAFQTLADEYGYEITALEQKGMPFYKIVLKRRLGFLGGLLVFVLALYLMSSFVWFIEVNGNAKVETSTILSTAARHGIYQGAAKWSFSRNEVEEAMLRDLSQLSYIQLDIRGVKVAIKVVEKILPDERVTGPCHIIASRDGVIEEILVLEGQANVKKGQVVGKGDILISGIVFPPVPYVLQGEQGAEQEAQQPYLVRARGQVKARTWYEGYGECRMRLETKELTGQKETAITIETPWKDIALLGKTKTSFLLYQQENYRRQIKTPWGNFGMTLRKLREEKIRATEYKQENAVEIARKKALQQLYTRMSASHTIVDSDVEILSSPGDSIVRLKIMVEILENIAAAQALNPAEISN